MFVKGLKSMLVSSLYVTSTCCLDTGLSETGSRNPARPAPQPCHVIISP